MRNKFSNSRFMILFSNVVDFVFAVILLVPSAFISGIGIRKAIDTWISDPFNALIFGVLSVVPMIVAVGALYERGFWTKHD